MSPGWLTDRGPLTLGCAALRQLASLLSSAILGVGYLMAGLRRDKRALHDLIAGSRVERLIPPRPLVRRVQRPAPVQPEEPPATLVDSPLTPVAPPARSVEPPPPTSTP